MFLQNGRNIHGKFFSSSHSPQHTPADRERLLSTTRDFLLLPPDKGTRSTVN